jgi:hypothetical protein
VKKTLTIRRHYEIGKKLAEIESSLTNLMTELCGLYPQNKPALKILLKIGNGSGLIYELGLKLRRQMLKDYEKLLSTDDFAYLGSSPDLYPWDPIKEERPAVIELKGFINQIEAKEEKWSEPQRVGTSGDEPVLMRVRSL